MRCGFDNNQNAGAFSVSVDTPVRRPHTCPVCYGVGKVEAGFYNRLNSKTWTSSGGEIECSSCQGTGIVWEEVAA